MFRPLLSLFVIVLAVSCTSPEKPEAETVLVPPAPPVPSQVNYSYKSFEVFDSTGAPRGWGYDIYQGDKRVIHQLSIPGEPGIDGFVSAEESDKVANMVASKLQSGGGFPTITHDELVQLGITLKTP